MNRDLPERPRVLVAHEQALIGRAVQRVLDLHGFEVDWCARGQDARAKLQDGRFDAFVVDVGLPDEPGFLLIDEAREQGVRAIVLAAAVYRKTSYKRRPTRLYGADDYVEIHHLGDHLPARLRQHLGMDARETEAGEARRIHELFESLGDERLIKEDPKRLAELLVADMLLYNADAIGIGESQLVRERLAEQMGQLSHLFLQLHTTEDGVGEDEARGLVTDALAQFLGSGFSDLADELRGAGEQEASTEAS